MTRAPFGEKPGLFDGLEQLEVASEADHERIPRPPFVLALGFLSVGASDGLLAPIVNLDTVAL